MVEFLGVSGKMVGRSLSPPLGLSPQYAYALIITSSALGALSVTWESWERKARMLIDRFPFQLLMLCYRFGIVLGSMMKRYPREQYRENFCTPGSILRPLLGACFEDMRHEKHMGFLGFPWKRLPSEIAFTLWKHGTFVKTTAYKTTKKRGFPWQGSSKLDFSQNYTISPETWVSSSRLDANPFFAT